MQGGTLTLATGADKLIFDNYMVGSSGTIDNHGHLVFNDGGLVFLDFQMNGDKASLTVGENSTVRITDQDFDLDGAGTSTNVTTIESGGKLTVGLNDALADDGFNHTININGGELEVTNDADNSWSIGFLTGGELNAGGAAISTVSGHELNMLGTVNVSTGSQLNVETDRVFFNGDADLNIEAGAKLNVNTNSDWVSSSVSVTGAGELRPGAFTIGGSTADDVVWDVANVDLDDGGGGTINAGSSLTVNADTIDTNDQKFSQDLVIEDGGKLELNLSGGTAVFGNQSSVTINGNTSTETTFFDSSNGTVFDIEGAFDVNGDATAAARVIFDFTNVNINDASGYLKLAGGSQTPGDTNITEAVAFYGPGQLRIANGAALRGSAGIYAPINGASNSQLIAEGGQMNIFGDLLQIGTIGTVETGILNFDAPWETSVANEVRLEGGTIIGETITNNGAAGINGWGTVTAEIINETRIDAEGGGTLIIDNNANDWDGTTDAGALNAVSGNLELRDDVGFAFGGTVRAAAGREVFANGFSLQFLPSSTLDLNGGTYRATYGADFLGALSASGACTPIGGRRQISVPKWKQRIPEQRPAFGE